MDHPAPATSASSARHRPSPLPLPPSPRYLLDGEEADLRKLLAAEGDEAGEVILVITVKSPAGSQTGGAP